MEILLAVTIEDGKAVLDKQKFLDLVSTLPDGRAIMRIKMDVAPKSLNDYRRIFFHKVHTVHDYLGEDKNTIYQEFLEYCGIESTKDIDIETMKVMIRTFELWAFTKFNVIT